MHSIDEFQRREAIMIAQKLHLIAEDVGLTASEVEIIVDLNNGVWPLVGATLERWSPTVQQETRLRQLLEVCVFADWRFGKDAALWMRHFAPSLGTSPVYLMMEEPEGLRAMRDAFRREAQAR